MSVTLTNVNTDVTLNPASLSFDATDWETPKSVSVTARHDDDSADDTATINLSATGGGYNSASESVSVSVTDNDTAGLTIAQEGDPLKVAEGDSVTFTVRLATQPSADVTVSVVA